MFGAGEERPCAAGGQHFYPVERYGREVHLDGLFPDRELNCSSTF
jgi:hypothetical protein